MLRRSVILPLFFFAVVLAHPTEMPDGSGSSSLEFGLTFSEEIPEDEVQVSQREEALLKLQQMFGIPDPTEGSNQHKVPPQFMMELYNTIADPSGVTRGKNPYNAKIVRSFIERDNSMSQYYLFNISGLETNESVLEAELHLYRKRTPLKAMHPAVLSSPYYLIRVYQVLDERQLDIPDLHRLLNVHYVGAHASGWQVFNVKQAVLSWVSGAPNLGLLVTASNLFGNDAAVYFSRRNDYHHSKQPILVLFDDDGKERPVGENITPHYYYKYANDLESEEEPDTALAYEDHNKTPRNGRHTNPEMATEKDNHPERLRRDTSIRKRILKIDEAMTSMDIYERSRMRRKLTGRMDADTVSGSASKRRSPRSIPVNPPSGLKPNTTDCARHELYVNFEEIGWSNYVIAPKGYSAYHCKGHCNFPLSQGQHPTNHATVQSIVHMLRQGKDVNQPCCVPTKLLSSSLLYFDHSDNVVFKLYEDMVADRCGCH